MTEPEPQWWKQSVPAPDLRPRLSNGFGKALAFESDATNVRITFPYWDNRQDIQGFVQWLRTAPDGGEFSDLDQGWQIDALRLNDRFHFLDRNFDTDEVYANVSVVRDDFLKALDRAEAEAG
jgi:hypothetical protein